MATQRVPVSVSPLQFPSKSSPKHESVTQLELGALLSLRQRAKQIEEQISAAEQLLQTRLESGVTVEPGLFRASLNVSERKNVSWKSIVERELGSGYAQRVLAATKPDRYIKLIVTA